MHGRRRATPRTYSRRNPTITHDPKDGSTFTSEVTTSVEPKPHVPPGMTTETDEERRKFKIS